MPAENSESEFENRQVMDVSTPGEGVPTPTARPIIVQSRSMVNADPMVARQRDARRVPEDSLRASEDTTQEKSATQPKDGEDGAVAPPTPTEDKLAEEPASHEHAVSPTASSHKKKTLAPTDLPNESKATDVPTASTGVGPENQVEENEALENLRQRFQGEKVPDSELESSKREAELLSHLEDDTYTLQIHKKKGHFERVLLVVLVVGLLLLIGINVALDLGTIKIGRAHV